MRVGILYICTWKYDIFWKEFYISCEKYFLKSHEKHYFIFTDSKNIFDSENNDYIHVFHQKNLGRPDNTLMRFHIFLSQKKSLEKMDYLFFFNANLEIQKAIWEEILPSSEEWLVVTQHPWFYNKWKNKFPYDKNKNSTAYIEKWEWMIYVQGALNGWSAKDFLNMAEVLANNIDIDNRNNIVALWHDESHLNRYIINKKTKVLDPWYLYPETFDIPYDCKILIRDKSKLLHIHKIKWGWVILDIKNYIIMLIKNIKKVLKYPLDIISYLTGINHCYSQTGEDLILKHVIHKNKGFYIDIGANHPVHYNNTYMLYKKWRSGINIEPNKSLIKKFKSKRPRDINLQVAGGLGKDITFYCFNPSTMSTCDPVSAEKYKTLWYKLQETYTVPVMWIKEIIETYAINKQIDVLSVDVEWYDLIVLKTNDRSKYKPNYVILETVEYSKDGTGKKLNHTYDTLFEQRGYEKFADTYINTIYKRKDH